MRGKETCSEFVLRGIADTRRGLQARKTKVPTSGDGRQNMWGGNCGWLIKSEIFGPSWRGGQFRLRGATERQIQGSGRGGNIEDAGLAAGKNVPGRGMERKKVCKSQGSLKWVLAEIGLGGQGRPIAMTAGVGGVKTPSFVGEKTVDWGKYKLLFFVFEEGVHGRGKGYSVWEKRAG